MGFVKIYNLPVHQAVKIYLSDISTFIDARNQFNVSCHLRKIADENYDGTLLFSTRCFNRKFDVSLGIFSIHKYNFSGKRAFF